MQTYHRRIFALAGALLCLTTTAIGNTESPRSSISGDRVYLEQGWSDEIRHRFWFTSQGSRILPYAWFLALEQEASTKLFRSDEHMDALRYIPEKQSYLNTDGLPIGFVADIDSSTGQKWLGLTCAACHTNQLDYGDHSFLIEGAPTLANFDKFFSLLVNSLLATAVDDEKFARFASKVANSSAIDDSIHVLRKNLQAHAERLKLRRDINALPEDYPSDFSGYGRLDAFGQISNAASALALAKDNNRNPPTAPVSYPFLWGAHQSNVVQWNGTASNTSILGPLVRNVGEVIGVFGSLEIRKYRLIPERHRYSHSVDLNGLVQLESWMKDLRAPRWPENKLTKIDNNKKVRGEEIFKSNCVGCHKFVAYDRQGERYKATMKSLSAVGTDPAMAVNAACNHVKTHTLENEEKYILAGGDFGQETVALNIAVNGVVGVLLDDRRATINALKQIVRNERRASTADELAQWTDISENTINRLRQKLRRELERNTTDDETCPDGVANLDKLEYKARPLNGIWATAPYLHNGSVPNLWALLQHPDDRPTVFTVGSREFDPHHVGFREDKRYSTFNVFRADGSPQHGNSNRGHPYGVELENDEKWALIEYLKSL